MFKKNNERVARCQINHYKSSVVTKKGIDLAYNTKSMPYMVPLTSED